MQYEVCKYCRMCQTFLIPSGCRLYLSLDFWTRNSNKADSKKRRWNFCSRNVKNLSAVKTVKKLNSINGHAKYPNFDCNKEEKKICFEMNVRTNRVILYVCMYILCIIFDCDFLNSNNPCTWDKANKQASGRVNVPSSFQGKQ